MTDFSSPQRMGLNAFLIIFIKIFKTIFDALIIYILLQIFDSDVDFTSGDVWMRLVYAFGATVVASVLLAMASYFPKKFYVKDGSLVFMHGLLNRETTTIPLGSIHSLRTRQGIWYRILDMRGIVFDTLASKGAEIELILDDAAWQSMLHLMESGEHPTPAVCSGPPEYNPARTMQFGNRDLLLDALCQNHLKGMVILGGFLLALFDRMINLTGKSTEAIMDYTMTFYDELLMSPALMVILFLAIYIVVLALWVGRVFLRYGNMTMRYDRMQLMFTHGVLARSGCRFRFGKICTIWIKRNFMEKRLGLCTLMLRQALNVTAEKENDNLKVYGTDTSSFFLKWWLGGEYKTEPDIVSVKSGRGVFFRSFLQGLAVGLIATVVLCYFKAYVWIWLPAIYLLISAIRGACAMHRSRIILKDTYLVVHNGYFAESVNYIKYGNIEVVRIRRTPFTRFSHRVTLILSTPGSTFSVRSLPETDAMHIYELLLLKTES